MALAGAVAGAIAELHDAFPDASVAATEDGQGGAVIVIDAVPLGAPYIQEATWVGFTIPFNYPFADVYPFFVRGDLARQDGEPLGPGTSTVAFDGRPNEGAVQLSRSSPRRDAAIDTALRKLLRVLDWVRSL